MLKKIKKMYLPVWQGIKSLNNKSQDKKREINATDGIYLSAILYNL